MSEKWLKVTVLLLSVILPAVIAFSINKTFQTTAPSLDALSHLYIAKNVIHNGSNSGIRNLGTIWLPFYHTLLFPFVAIDALYFTGFAGTFLGIILLFATTFIFLRFLPYPNNLCAALLFISHPYLLLLTGSSMTETLTILLLLFTAYYFHQFLKTGKGMPYLIIGVVLGTLTRYEFYPIPFFILPFFIWRLKKNLVGGRLRVLAKTYYLPLLLFAGIFFWLFWNGLLFSDPLFFYRHPVVKDTVGRLYYAGSILKVVRFNCSVLKELFGYLPLFSALGILTLIGKRKLTSLLAFAILVSPLVIHSFLAYHNISLGYARFFLLSFPGLILLAFSFVQHLPNKILRWPGLFTILLLYLLSILPAYKTKSLGTNHYQDKIILPDKDINYPKVSHHLKDLKSFFNGLDLSSSHILIPFNQEFQVISFALRLRPEMLFDAYDEPLILEIMKRPWDFCDYILLPLQPTSFCYRFQNYYQGDYFVLKFFEQEAYREKIFYHFNLIRESRNYKLYQRVQPREEILTLPKERL